MSAGGALLYVLKSTLHTRRGSSTAEHSLNLLSNGECWLNRLNTWSDITEGPRVAPTEMGPPGRR